MNVPERFPLEGALLRTPHRPVHDPYKVILLQECGCGHLEAAMHLPCVLLLISPSYAAMLFASNAAMRDESAALLQCCYVAMLPCYHASLWTSGLHARHGVLSIDGHASHSTPLLMHNEASISQPAWRSNKLPSSSPPPSATSALLLAHCIGPCLGSPMHSLLPPPLLISGCATALL